jgi:60 kDa SS-A/Ro ribonucleoprotein
MANKALFRSTRGKMLPAAAAINNEGARAYAFEPKHALAQYAATGTLSNTFYANAEEQLETVLALTRELDAEFIAKTAIYARTKASMKDVPALLLAVLSAKNPELFKAAFPKVVDNGRMLRTFVQIMRSGVTGRKSLGSSPKRLVEAWLNTASDAKLIDAAVGTNPSLRDIVRMVHPKPTSAEREALFAWVLNKPYEAEMLPESLEALVKYRADPSAPVPNVPFQMLTALNLNAEAWAQVARSAGWHMVRMNLNTFARHGVFEIAGMTEVIAERLRDPVAIAKARVFPYQLMAAYFAAGPQVPSAVKDALQDAMEIALERVAVFSGRVVVCPDVSGSMASAVTGSRKGGTSAISCIQVAALVTAAIVRANRNALVLPFAEKVKAIDINARDSVMSNAAKLAALGGGGTSCSAPIKRLIERRERADLVVLVSDNQSWVDNRPTGPTETLRLWETFKNTNRDAKLVCIDLQPNRTAQAVERKDVLNVGGFSDEVFAVVEQFASGALSSEHWIGLIEAVNL